MVYIFHFYLSMVLSLNKTVNTLETTDMADVTRKRLAQLKLRVEKKNSLTAEALFETSLERVADEIVSVESLLTPDFLKSCFAASGSD